VTLFSLVSHDDFVFRVKKRRGGRVPTFLKKTPLIDNKQTTNTSQTCWPYANYHKESFYENSDKKYRIEYGVGHAQRSAKNNFFLKVRQRNEIHQMIPIATNINIIQYYPMLFWVLKLVCVWWILKWKFLKFFIFYESYNKKPKTTNLIYWNCSKSPMDCLYSRIFTKKTLLKFSDKKIKLKYFFVWIGP